MTIITFIQSTKRINYLCKTEILSEIFFSILIVFTIALRPVLPVVNYVVNYDYIAEKLCENKAKPELMCNGKCYLSKELSKSNQEQGSNGRKIVIASCDAFLINPVFKLNLSTIYLHKNTKINNSYVDFYRPIFYSNIFRPPLV